MMGQKYDVRFTLTLPEGVEATPQEVERWVRFELHEVAELRKSPVSHLDMEADYGSVSVDEAW